jgi:hypothetical protein
VLQIDTVRNQVPVVAGSLRLTVTCSVHLFIPSYTPTPTFPPPEPNTDKYKGLLRQANSHLVFCGKRSYSLWLGGVSVRFGGIVDGWG